MSSWSDAMVARNERLGPDLYRLTLEVPPAVARAFHRPGQYHRVRVGEGAESPFALASAPGEAAFDYFIRRGQGVSAALAASPPGSRVQVSPPEGPGFPLEHARGLPLLLVATGTAWAPMRSVLRTLVRERSAFGPVRALYGALTPAHLGYADEFEALRAAGVDVVPIIDAPDAGWSGAVGRVQQHLSPLPGARTVAFLAGHPEMVTDVTAQLGALGVARDRVFLNL